MCIQIKTYEDSTIIAIPNAVVSGSALPAGFRAGCAGGSPSAEGCASCARRFRRPAMSAMRSHGAAAGSGLADLQDSDGATRHPVADAQLVVRRRRAGTLLRHAVEGERQRVSAPCVSAA